MSCFSISDPKILFIHIPKNGGTSLQQAFQDVFKTKYHHKKVKINIGKSYDMHAHQSGMLIYNKLYKNWNDYFVFSVVRNPWDRLVSIWKFVLSDSRVFRDAYKIGVKDKSFEELIRIEREKSFEEWVLSYRRPCFFKGADMIGGRPLTRIQQKDWLHMRGKSLTHRTYKLENLEKISNDFKKKYKVDLKIGHTNKTNRDHYSLYYSPKLVDTVSGWYANDIKIWGYEF